jgi:hypothetical protein
VKDEGETRLAQTESICTGGDQRAVNGEGGGLGGLDVKPGFI